MEADAGETRRKFAKFLEDYERLCREWGVQITCSCNDHFLHVRRIKDIESTGQAIDGEEVYIHSLDEYMRHLYAETFPH